MSVTMLLATGIGLVACGDGSTTSPAIEITDAAVDKPVPRHRSVGVYAKIHNGTDREITIVGASSPEAPEVQLHMTITGDDGTTMMQQVESFPVAGGANFEFERDGPHVMLTNVDTITTFPGGEAPMVLMLSDGTEVPFDASVAYIMEETIPTSTSG